MLNWQIEMDSSRRSVIRDQQIVSQDVDGYALYLVMLLLLVIGFLASIAFRQASITRQLAAQHSHKIQAHYLAQSGIARAEYFLSGGDGHDLAWHTEKLEEQLDLDRKITISCEPFGLYSRIKSIGRYRNKKSEIYALAGRTPLKELEPTITLTGGIQGLGLFADASLQGPVVLDHGNVVRWPRQSRIPGLDKATTQKKSPPLPFDRQKIDDLFTSCSLSIHRAAGDTSAIGRDFTVTNESLKKLRSNTISILGKCEIAAVKLKQRTIIAQGKLTIASARASLSGCKLLGESIEIRAGYSDKCLFFSQGTIDIEHGTHNSQFVAVDTIFAGKDVEWEWMSLWLSRHSLTPDSAQQGGIVFESNGAYNGIALAISDSVPKHDNKLRGPSITLRNGATFNGIAISDGDIELQPSRVSGNLYAEHVAGKREGGTVVNTLFGTSIRRSQTVTTFPLLGKGRVEIRLNGF
ncbi:MAG: hypothetical protein GF398_18300 [Chitinivibrionales bacterium]|nr:hypothetical protein [Chitinivibrionales bacterium]